MPCATKRVSWDAIEDRLHRTVPASLFDLLRDLKSRVPDPYFYVADYSYGKLIIDRGHFRPPCQEHACRDCAGLVKSLLQQKDYIPAPLSLILQGCVEIFVEYSEERGAGRQAPIRMLRSSEMFGVFETLDRLMAVEDQRPFWSLSSGSRSIFIIAPLGDERLIEKLAAQVGTHISWREGQRPHWKLVETVTQNKHPWKSQVLILPKPMIDAAKASPGFFHALLETGWRQSVRVRHTSAEDAVLRGSIQQSLNALSLPQGELFQYVTVRHFLDMARGLAPVFQSADEQDIQAGPFMEFCTDLQSALKKLRHEYVPIVLQPTLLDKHGESGYYSLRCPTLLGPKPPEKRERPLLDLVTSYKHLFHELEGDNAKLLSQENITFYVRRPDSSKMGLLDGIKPNNDVPLEDFYPAGPKNNNMLFLGSPFLLAVARIMRVSGVREKSRAVSKVS
jgi:hypothetical protein